MALEKDNQMCLCGLLDPQSDALPEESLQNTFRCKVCNTQLYYNSARRHQQPVLSQAQITSP